MSNIPVAKNKRTSFENVEVKCPHCGCWSIFNRASDLQTFEPIAGHDVTCLNDLCRKRFRIVGDSINNPHEMLVYDCYELMERKHYMNCILSLAQSYEMFFSLFLRVELLYKPFGADPNRELAEMYKLGEELENKIREHTFAKMRALFLQHLVNGHSRQNLAESAQVIAALPERPEEPNNEAIEGLSDQRLVPLLLATKKVGVHTLRNRVVHKQAYRPTREEVRTALEEAKSVLLPLTSHLQLQDDINFYLLSS